MDDFLFFIRIFLAIIFISTAIEKIIRIKTYLQEIVSYKLLPQSLTKIFGGLNIFLELFLALCLFTGSWLVIGVVGSIVLLSIYNLAITINIIRGRTGISCGCGGLLGKGEISWMLVFRNTFLKVALLPYFFIEENSENKIISELMNSETVMTFTNSSVTTMYLKMIVLSIITFISFTLLQGFINLSKIE